MPLPRRMFAGERLRFHRPLRIGETIRRETELADISIKAGGTGTLVFATVVQRIFTADGLAIEEERRTVFREEVRAGERNQAPRREPAPADVPWRRRVTPDAGAALPLLRAHVQQPPHPLRSPWAMERRGLPRRWSSTGRSPPRS